MNGELSPSDQPSSELLSRVVVLTIDRLNYIHSNHGVTLKSHCYVLQSGSTRAYTTAMSLSKTTQIVAFIKRNPNLSREDFYKYWSTIHAPLVAPWAEKHGIISYRQNHSAGTIVPSIDIRGAPNAKTENIPTTPQEYDGWVVWEVPSLEAFGKAFEDPYYLQFIEPDEHNLIDKGSFGGGIVATFSSSFFEVVWDGKSALNDGNTDEFRKRFEEFEASQK